MFPYQYLYGLTSRRNVARRRRASFPCGRRLSQATQCRWPGATSQRQSRCIFPTRIGRLANANASLPSTRFRTLPAIRRYGSGCFTITARPRILAGSLWPASATIPASPVIPHASTAAEFEPKTYPIRATQHHRSISARRPGRWTPVDFLRLRLKVNYSPLWKLRKPERMQLGDQPRRRQPRTEVICTGAGMFPPMCGFIRGGTPTWETTLTPMKLAGAKVIVRSITELRLLVSPLDWVSQTPAGYYDGVGRRAAIQHGPVK